MNSTSFSGNKNNILNTSTNFGIGSGLRGVGASIIGGNPSNGGHPLVPQVKLQHLRSPTIEDSVMSNGGYSVFNSGNEGNRSANRQNFAFSLSKRGQSSESHGPTKHGRTFRVELGQNEGPFKRNEVLGQPQIDKFGTTHLNSSIASGSISLQGGTQGILFQSLSGGMSQMSPRIAILGQHSYRPEERGLTDEATNSISNQIKTMEDNLVLGFDLLTAYKDESQKLHVDIDHLLNNLIEKNADVLTSVQPDLIDDYKTLKSHIHEQKDDNEALYKQLLALKKETTSSAQKIAMFRSRIERLEKTLGVQQPLQYQDFENDAENTILTQGFKGSVYQTQTQGFNLDDAEDDHPVGNIGAILNSIQPTMEDEDLLENELI